MDEYGIPWVRLCVIWIAVFGQPIGRYKDSPAGGGQRNDWIHQVAKEKEMDI